MPLTSKGTPYVVSTDLVANYPTVSSDLADHIDDNLQYNAQDINAQTGSGANAYTFTLADASLYKLVTASNAAAATYTVPPQSSVTWAAGAVLRILNQGAGVVTLAGGSGVTLNGSVLTLNQYQYAEIHRTASNTWTVVGMSTPPGSVLVSPTSIANSGGSASASGGAVTFSGVTSISLNGVFSSTYDNYRININLTSATVGAQNLGMRLRSAGSDNTSSVYGVSQVFSVYSTTTLTVNNSSDTNNTWLVHYVDTASGSRTIEVLAPNLAARTHMQSNGGNLDAWSIYMGTHNSTTQFDGFSMYLGSGNMTGIVRCYGYRN